MRRVGVFVAVTASLAAIVGVACLDDPTFIQVDAGLDGTVPLPDATGSSTSSSGTSKMGSSSSSTSSSGAPNPCTASTCEAAGGVCEGDTCAFRCPGTASPAACGGQITCPTGANCIVVCGAKNACKKITCDSPSCNIGCNGDTACSDQIDTTSPSTTIACSGNNACSKVDCKGAACTVTCAGPACQPPMIECCASSCTVNGAPGMCK